MDLVPLVKSILASPLGIDEIVVGVILQHLLDQTLVISTQEAFDEIIEVLPPLPYPGLEFQLRVPDLSLALDAINRNLPVSNVCLWAVGMGDDDAARLASALENNKLIKTLDLSQNRITDIGAKSIAKAMKTHPGIVHVNLSKNQIGLDGITELKQAFLFNNQIDEVNVSYNFRGEDTILHRSKWRLTM